ncbi:RCC1 domain-containing protein [Motilibacter deserti]|uniref:LamG-like jellyroll fold domain-containing protein n=1 Tax=Motilibacter deserti TaxID=2714956 RepID=A0ABX0GT46_9ACTN|nr:LamG-like jellyroll fold domain-containing protein [Motilibacter deserti]NHC13296.1 hypothetical protein [Motilibacter deserti]
MTARTARGVAWAGTATVVALLAAAMTPVAPPAEAATAVGASAWGQNAYAQLGDGTTTARKTPVTARLGGRAAGLAAGDRHSLAVAEDGTVLAWGSNAYGQLGDGTVTTRKTPVRVGTLTDVVAVAAGAYASVALRADGTVWAWGRNTAGQLGDGTLTNRRTPVRVPGLTDVRAIAAGDTFTLAVKTDGTVWAWGANASGQLGDGTVTTRKSPVRVTGISNVLSVAAGIASSVALRADGTVWTWGANAYGQLGDGTLTTRKTPVQAVGVTGAVAVDAGDQDTLVLRSDGTVRAWGRNQSGQLGDGTTTTRRTAVSVTGLAGVTGIAAGDTHTLAVLADGTVRAWGANGNGQLGDGTATARKTPVVVKGLSEAGVIAAGTAHTLAAARNEASGPQPSGWWPAEGDGDDAAGDLTASLGAGVGFTTGAVACAFDVPADSAVEIADDPAVEPRAAFSFSAWVSPQAVTGRRVVAAKSEDGRQAWALAVVDGKLSVDVSADGSDVRTVTSTSAVVAAKRWQQVAVTFDGSVTEPERVKLYVGGLPVAAAATAGPHSSVADVAGPLRLGGPGWSGGIDEARVFPGPLTAAQVADVQAGDVASAGAPCDLVAPVTAAALSPKPNTAGWNNAPVAVTLTATDNTGGTGVGSLTYSASGAQEVEEDSADGDTATLTVTEEGLTTVSASASDTAGNTEEARAFAVRVDRSAPTATVSRAPAANAQGWNNGPVTVAWECADAVSGVASCPAPRTFDTDGAGQYALGSVVDAAGNTAAVRSGDVSIDTTAPTLTAGLAVAPHASGWYREDVRVSWSATDALSGIDGAAPADGVIDGEGRGLTTSARVSDRAGNVTVATSPAVSIDRTAPVTTASAPEGWVRGAAVKLSAADNLSGVAATWWQLDEGQPQQGDHVDIDEDGIHDLRFWSVDAAGNAEEPATVRVHVDSTAPVVTHRLDPEPNALGWLRDDVTVTFDCADGTSGVAECTAPVRVTAEGAGRTVTGSARDAAGNTATDVAVVSIDRTAPAVTPWVDAVAAASGWFNTPVTVSFDCADALSGVVECAGPVTLGEGRGQSATGTATDAAGNEGSGTRSGVDVDLTAPTLAGSAGERPTSGWWRDDVVVRWECDDALSGIDGGCPAPASLTGEGELSTVASVADRAGNTTVARVDGVRIDRTAPVTTADVAAALATGWHSGPVEVALAATDALSGVSVTRYSVDGVTASYDGAFTVREPGVHEIRFWSEDVAGNVEPAGSLTVRIDGIAPAVAASFTPAPNAEGWNNSPVDVTFTCGDDESGVAECPAPVFVGEDGAGRAVAGTAVDAAGNASTATAVVNLDTRAPEVSGAATTEPAATGWHREPVTVAFRCADELSGVADCPAAVTVDREGEGVVVSGTATDRAGNVSEPAEVSVDVDLTAPSVALAGGPSGTVEFGQVPDAPTCEARDATSGVAGCVVDGYGIEVGEHVVTATATDAAGWTSTATRAYTVVKARQAIRFDALGDKRAGDPDVNVVAVASSGLPVELRASGACTVFATTVHLVGAGQCSITASQPGNGSYEPAADVTRTFTVATTVLDGFDRANGWVGSDWAGTVGTAFYRVSGRALDVRAGGPLVYRAPFGTTQEAQITLTDVDPRSHAVGVLLKAQTGSIPSAGAISVTYDAKEKAVEVSTLRVGTLSWKVYTGKAVTFADGDVLRARVTAAGDVQVYRNATLVTTVTLSAADKAFFNPKGGQIGIWAHPSTSGLVDDFGGGTVG